MKKVVLIGDSIRLGYDKYIRNALGGVATVCSPEENCRFAQYVLRYAHEWKIAGEWGDDVDVVHWNAGLWDALRLFGEDPFTPLPFYADTLKRVHKRLRLLFPKAKIIFATSTAVQEEKYNGDFKRYNSEIREYNKTALEALKGLDVDINDLYSITENAPDECWSDMTHFNTSAGVKLVGEKVLSVLCVALGVDRNSLKDAKAEVNKVSDKILGY